MATRRCFLVPMDVRATGRGIITVPFVELHRPFWLLRTFLLVRLQFIFSTNNDSYINACNLHYSLYLILTFLTLYLASETIGPHTLTYAEFLAMGPEDVVVPAVEDEIVLPPEVNHLGEPVDEWMEEDEILEFFRCHFCRK